MNLFHKHIITLYHCYLKALLDIEVAAVQVDHVVAESRLEAEQGHHIVVVEEKIVVAEVDIEVVVFDIGLAVVVDDKGTPHHFVCTIPVWQWDSCTSE